MPAISQPNIESELSYAYLHAVASRVGAACSPQTRHHDNSGIDAEITSWGPFSTGGYLTEVDLRIQLKATIAAPNVSGGYIPYFVSGVERYNKLREHTQATPRVLVVLFLTPNSNDWLSHSPETLILKRCAYWVSLRNAPETTNETGQTVYIPENQHFSPAELTTLLDRLSKRDYPVYVNPHG
jgi:hypothetical protein